MATDLLAVQANRANLAIRRAAGDPDARRLEALFGSIATLATATGDSKQVSTQEREFLQSFVTTSHDTVESSDAVLDQAERILHGVIRSRGLPSVEAPGTTEAPRPRPTGRPIEVR